MTDTRSLVEQFFSAVHEAFQLDLSSETAAQLRWALSRVGQQNQGDLVAAAFLSCYATRREQGRPLEDADVRRAIWRVVKEASRDAARNARLDPLLVHVPTPGPSPEEAAARRDDADRISRAIESLPVLDQAAFLQRMGGASIQEIARELDMTEVAVRQRLHRARGRVRRILGADKSDIQ
jgi:RNA polymerase sigma factor (sigma-70 family)